MAPTRIYVKQLLNLIKQSEVHALSHITGGGLLENLPRVMPANTKAIIDINSWERPAIFNWLQKNGNIDGVEMHRTFNCGLGMVIVVPAAKQEEAMQILAAEGETAYVIGKIESAKENEEQVQLEGL